MAFYECVLLIKSQLTEEEVGSVLERFQGLVTSKDGTVHHIQKLGKRRLSYELKKERRADYAIFYIEMKNTTDIAEFDRQARLDERVIKSMVVRREKLVLPSLESAGSSSEERGEHTRTVSEGEAV
ncbi:MAG: 30S ribosomal protein S6 [Leptospirales bacterium]